MNKYKLPELPYDYNALEPYIDETTMYIHHQRHHQGYVDGANKALKKLRESRERNDFDLIRHWQRELAFNASGHINHTLFWHSMSPDEGNHVRSPGLRNQIYKDFGSFDQFKSHFISATSSVEGSGWGMLVWDAMSNSLMIRTAENHQNTTITGSMPILLVDVWEHAYYLKYLNDREEYLKSWWEVINWKRVSHRLEALKRKHG
jgi:Fe-Mn family superoxide dismutase